MWTGLQIRLCLCNLDFSTLSWKMTPLSSTTFLDIQISDIIQGVTP